nr:hypothetical protein [Actinomadura fibrosa]
MTRITRSNQSGGRSRRSLGDLGHDGGVVDEDVDAAVRGDRGLDHRGRRRPVGDVGLHGGGLEAVGGQGRGGPLGAVAVEVGQQHRRAGLGQRAAVDLADGSGAAGDDGDLAVQAQSVECAHGASLRRWDR